MKVFITNTVALNGGDAAILISLKEILQDAFGKDIELVVYDSQPDVAKQYYPEFTFRKLLYQQVSNPDYLGWILNKIPYRRIRILAKALAKKCTVLRFRLALALKKKGWQKVALKIFSKQEQRILENYSEADLIVSTGGTYLTENYQLEPRLLDYIVSIALERPLVFFTQTLGPFSTPKYRRVLRHVFEETRLLLLRDEASLQNVRELNVKKPNVYVRPDSVFALANPAELDRAARRPVPSAENLRVAISVRKWPYFRHHTVEQGMKRYKNAIRTVTEHFVKEHSAKVTFVSTCQGIPEYHYNDAEIATSIVQSLPKSIRAHTCLNDEFHHPLELRDLLSTYDLVISTRMHMAILALIAGTPVLPISYEFKTRELFTHLEMERWVHDIENLDGDTLKRSTDAFISELSIIRKHLYPEKIKNEYRQARETAVLLREAFISA